ncbi:MAG: Hsp20/alpha crystallin family protein [Nitrospirae bacterium]|nr:Hsp20/alpha crystallin family protein [Nitrospirota bacterium]
MKIIRWDPFKDMMMVEDLFNALVPGEKEHACTWSPVVDVYETTRNIVLTAELPGVHDEDIDLTIYDNVLTLKGDRKFEKDVKQENFHRIERNYGFFNRRFTMPCEVDSAGIEAAFKDGVLKVTIPKKDSVKKVHVKVQGK